MFSWIRGFFTNFRESMIALLITLPVILITISVHEFSHAFVANRMGDPTARSLGRMTLNPIKHIDPIGFICMIFLHFGWAKPVPVNARYFKNPKKGMALTALAGPISNIILMIIGCILLNFYMLIPMPEAEGFLRTFWVVGYNFFYYFPLLNIYFAIFNFLPIPPLDGSRILFVLLPDKYYFGIMKYERVIMIVFLLLLVTNILTIPISFVADNIFDGFMYLLGLIPLFAA